MHLLLETSRRLRRRTAKHFVVGVLAIGLLSGLWGFWWEPSGLGLVERTIVLRQWHREHSGLRVAVMSDLHVGAPYRDLAKTRELVVTTNAQKPDLILLLGDLVIQGVLGGRFVDPEHIAAELGGLQAPLGVVAVLGNHDWWFDGLRVRRALESHGIRVLEDEALRLTYREKPFWIAGLADLLTRGNHLNDVLARIDDDEPILLVMHNPDVFPEVPPRVSLSLAGHTHGGQVNLPVFGRPIVPSKFGQRYAYGLVEETGRTLFVTGGVGTSILPVRFRVPPEIVLLTLTDP